MALIEYSTTFDVEGVPQDYVSAYMWFSIATLVSSECAEARDKTAA